MNIDDQTSAQKETFKLLPKKVAEKSAPRQEYTFARQGPDLTDNSLDVAIAKSLQDLDEPTVEGNASQGKLASLNESANRHIMELIPATTVADEQIIEESKDEAATLTRQRSVEDMMETSGIKGIGDDSKPQTTDTKYPAGPSKGKRHMLHQSRTLAVAPTHGGRRLEDAKHVPSEFMGAAAPEKQNNEPQEPQEGSYYYEADEAEVIPGETHTH